MQLIDYRRFADTRVSGDKHELRPPSGNNAIERRNQSIDLTLPAVQVFRYQQSVRQVVLPRWEWVDVTM